MAAKYKVQPKRSNERKFTVDTSLANLSEDLKSFGEYISMVDEVVASMSMLCGMLSSSTPLSIEPKRMVQLTSCEEQVFEVDEDVASESMFVMDMIETLGKGHPLALNVSSIILPKVIDYCKYCLENREASELTSATTAAGNAITPIWNAASMSKFGHATLFGLMLAAKDQRIQSLLDLTCQSVADMITGKPVEEVRGSTSKTTSLSRRKNRSGKRISGPSIR